MVYFQKSVRYYFVFFFIFFPMAAHAAGMPLGKPVTPPLGFIQYCLRNYDECSSKKHANTRLEMTEKLWRDLQDVQALVNGAIKPESDMENAKMADSWDFPRNGYGDCEDYAILKKRLLAARGWPKEALLLTTARTEQNEPHVVLTVATTAGDYILDNRFNTVQNWERVAYTWLARQDSANPLRWDAAGFQQERVASLSYSVTQKGR